MLSHNDVSTRIEKSQQLGDALQKLFPMLRFHSVANLGVVIKDCRYDGKFNFNGDTNAKVVGFRHGIQLV